MEKIGDLNDLQAKIANNTPIVILFGPRSCGKTMTFVRLTRWLDKVPGYRVEPDRNFMPYSDFIFKATCEHFYEIVNSYKAAPSTPLFCPTLFNVSKGYGEPICQILDLNGALCFDETSPSSPFPYFMECVMNIRNKKIWIFFVEVDREKVEYLTLGEYRRFYADKISKMSSRIAPSDKVIFVCPKVDKSLYYQYEEGQPYQFFKTVKKQYPGIFSQYESHNLIFRSYNFDFLVFSAGDKFFHAEDGSTYYLQGPDSYPENLWKSIMKAVGKQHRFRLKH